MSILIKSAQILDPRSPYHLQKKNILISDAGIIKSIGTDLTDARKVIESKNLKVSIGWFDMRANFNDPGMEHKEDLHSGCMTAAAGGFTGVAVLPNSKPCIESKNEVSYIQSVNDKYPTQLFVLGAVTKSCKGEELTEMLDMHAAGAVGFTDGENPIWNTDILLKTLLYLQKFNGLLINKPEDKYLTAFGNMNEGITSTLLGMKGMPGLAEKIMLKRDLQLLKYAGGRIHFANISTSGSIDKIKKAKKKGLNVTCDVAAHHLIFDESFCSDYDTNYKVNPPLRSSSDMRALDKAIQRGIIDVIVSSHSPQDEESKNLEFDLAEFGMIGQQTFLPTILKKAKEDNFTDYLEKFTTNPRKILGLTIPTIKEEEKANLTVFDPDLSWQYDEASNLSKSHNSPLFGKTLKGKVLGVINNGKSYIDPALK